MKLLFVKPKHIGDTLLMTPTLTAVRAQQPKSEIWAVVRGGAEDILAGCPAVDRVLPTADLNGSKEKHKRWPNDWRLIHQLRRQNFDFAFELSSSERGRNIAWLSGAQTCCANDTGRPMSRWWRNRFPIRSTFNWEFRHTVEKDFYTTQDALSLMEPIPPLIFEQAATEPSNLVSDPDFVILHPSTRWKRKKWPLEQWVTLGKKLLSQTHRLVISCGPDSFEISEADELSRMLGPKATPTQGRLNWAQLAGLLYRTRLFVGVDTAAMHLAAACQCPTIALFCDEQHRPWSCQWTPWRVDHHMLHSESGKISPDAIMRASHRLIRPPTPDD